MGIAIVLYLIVVKIKMIGTATLRSEIEDALEDASKCSEALAHLLKESRYSGVTTPEIFKKIREAKMHCEEANKHCEEVMERYTNAYRIYYKLCPGRI